MAAQAGVPNIGDSIQNSIDSMSDLIDSLLAAGVTVKDVDSTAESKNAAIQDSLKTVCITGKLPSGKKKSDYSALLKEAGYLLVDKVSKDLDYLVLADPGSTSSKAQKARKYGVELISEETLNDMII